MPWPEKITDTWWGNTALAVEWTLRTRWSTMECLGQFHHTRRRQSCRQFLHLCLIETNDTNLFQMLI
jgi:hypothetical protein